MPTGSKLAILIEFRVQKTCAQVEQYSGKKTRHTVYVNHTELQAEKYNRPVVWPATVVSVFQPRCGNFRLLF